ncbi:MAG TPA: hypothetical protein VFG39_03990, partial [Balneolaceae bacterium]|nr:hypothetical protein [Balneolaceae bacterium]
MPWLLSMTLVVSVIMAPAVLYLIWRYFQSAKIVFDQKWVRKIIPILLLSFYVFPICGLLDFFISGSVDVLKYFKPIVYWFWFGLVFTFQLATWVIIADIIKIIAGFFTEQRQALVRMYARAMLILLPVLLVFTAWKTYHQTTSIVIDNIELSVEGLPSALENFKIVHIS